MKELFTIVFGLVALVLLISWVYYGWIITSMLITVGFNHPDLAYYVGCILRVKIFLGVNYILAYVFT